MVSGVFEAEVLHAGGRFHDGDGDDVISARGCGCVYRSISGV